MKRILSSVGLGSLIIGSPILLLAADAPAPAAQAGGVSKQEKQELLSLRKDQGEAVIALNEALATVHELQRAQNYLAGWKHSKINLQSPSVEIEKLEQRLQELEDRFTTLRQAHFGPLQNVEGSPPARQPRVSEMRPEALRLIAEPTRRAEERAKIIHDYQQVRETAVVLVQKIHATLASLQEQASKRKNAPPFDPTPGFAKKPPATIKADGTPTGILFGNAGGGTYYSARINPAINALGFDYEVGGYDPFERSEKFLAQLKESAANGQRSTIVLPCAVHRNMANPADLWQKWLAEPSMNTNMPVFSLSGQRRKFSGHQFFSLDYYHPAVRSMMGEYLTGAASRYKDNPNALWYVTAWEARTGDDDSGSWGQWPVDVRTPAGLKDFRRYLQQRFGKIESLNAAWKSNYSSFDQIEFPPDLVNGPEPARGELLGHLFYGRCGALYYEFNRWLKDSYSEWLAFCYKTIKAADPTHPVAVSPSYGPIDSYLCNGYDAFQWAEKTCDVYAHQVTGSMQEVFLYSLKRLTGRTTGNNEYIWNEDENNDDPPEEINRAVAVRNLWRQIAWGRSALTFYGPNDTYGGGSYDNFMVFESAYQILRRSAGAIETTGRRLRSMEDVWLNAPVVEPQIAMLKPSASQICQQAWQLNESVMQNIHENLYHHQYHYAYVPEEYVLNGKDDLSRYRALILPWATHFPPGLNEKILAWVRSGGTLIISGIAGGFTPYGELDGLLMKEIFGVSDYQIWYGVGLGGDYTWMMNIHNLRDGVKDVGDHSYGQTLLAKYGKGQALMVARMKDLGPGGPATLILYELLDGAAPRRAWVEGAPVEMVLREKNGQLCVVLINPNVKQSAVATVHLAGKFRSATDRGIERGFAVPLRLDSSGQSFNITLTPGEGTVIVLTRS